MKAEDKPVESAGLLWDSGIAEQVSIPGKGMAYSIHEKMADGSWQTREDSTILDVRNDSRIVSPLKHPLWPLPGRPLDYGSDMELFDEKREYFQHYLELKDKRAFDLASAWVDVTWRTEEFSSLPYLFFIAPPGRAKSRFLELLAEVSYRGWLITHPTVASVFWAVDRYSPTLLADNYEHWPRETRHELDGLFNAGYRRGAIVPRRPREGESGGELQVYRVYSPKAIAGIRVPPDSLASRCAFIHMAKNRRGSPLEIDRDWAQKIRSKQLAYRFRHFESWGDKA